VSSVVSRRPKFDLALNFLGLSELLTLSLLLPSVRLPNFALVLSYLFRLSPHPQALRFFRVFLLGLLPTSFALGQLKVV
jgi:hypothetical protein